MVNKFYIYLTVAIATVSLFFTSCEDETSSIGSSISSSEVSINVDSVFYNIKGHTVAAPSIEARSLYNLLGSIDVPEYGSLHCSYVTEFLPAESISLPDTITSEEIDSVRMILSVPKVYVTGDTLSPQQVKIYSLTKNLPADITSNFNPDGYYEPSRPLAVKNYTLSGYSFNDTTYSRSSTVEIKANLPIELGREVVKAYASNPDLFIWPQEFAKYWPGIYVEPSFGKGTIAPVQNTSVFAYFPQTKTITTVDEDGKAIVSTIQVADSVCLFTTAPEVLSSINLAYKPSQKLEEMVNNKKSIITTPCGYNVEITFPAIDILDKYWKEEYELSVINNLKFSIPAIQIENDYNIGLPPALLMVKSNQVESFFSDGKLPDNMNSFICLYSSEDAAYTFTGLRNYIVDLRGKGRENITSDDVDFTLIPVNVSTEDYTDMNTGSTVTATTSVRPYTIMPTMVELNTEKALVVFTISNEILF